MKRIVSICSQPAFGIFVIAMLVVSLCSRAISQDLHNTTSLYIPAGTNLFVGGALHNSGFLQNKGIITVTGDWKNDQTYQGEGQIIFDGAANQRIFNNKQAIQHAVITGGGDKWIDDKIVITQQLDLRQGILFVEDEDTLLLKEKAIVTAGSLSSYVDGALTAEGPGYKFFPIGKNGHYHPVEFADIKGITPAIEVEVFNTVPEIQVPHASTFNDAYWIRKDIRGTFISSPISFGYKFSDDVVQSNVVIAAAEEVGEDFTVFDNTNVQQDGTLDKVSFQGELSGRFFVLGQSDLGYGHNIPPKAFYISTTLCPTASNPDNQVIKVFGNNLTAEDFHFEVFNRSAQPVFSSTSLDEMTSTGWNGSMHGTILPSGIYPYSLKALDKKGNVVKKQGVISIIN